MAPFGSSSWKPGQPLTAGNIRGEQVGVQPGTHPQQISLCSLAKQEIFAWKAQDEEFPSSSSRALIKLLGQRVAE